MATTMMRPMTTTATMTPTTDNTMMSGAMGGMKGMMVPRCTIKMEKCAGGMKMTCTTEDQMACTSMQNLCARLAGTLCSCCCMMNGMAVCCCNLVMGICQCEVTKGGCTITCTSGDRDCCAMIQSCCDVMTAMMQAGCTCCLMMNNTPVCCG